MYTQLLSLEAIDFQRNHKLAKVLEEELEDLRKNRYTVKDSGKIARHRIHRVVSEVVGLDITFKAVWGMEASVFVPDIDINCPVINSWRRAFSSGDAAEKLFKNNPVIEGYVDPIRALAGGDYSKIPVTINIGEMIFNQDMGGLTLREATAVVLHEIGHAFYYLWALGWTSTTNYILQDAARRFVGLKDEKTRTIILADAEEYSGVPVMDIPELKSVKNVDQCNVLFLKAAADKSRSDLGEDIYSMRGFEKLADNFASRLGYGRDVVTGLDKVLRRHGSDAYWSKFRFHLTQIGIFTMLTVGSLNPVVLILNLYLTFFNNGLEEEYDTPKRRFTAIINDTRALLKNRSIPAEEVSRALEDISVIRERVSKMEEHVNYFVRLNKIFQPSVRRQAKNMELQLLLEDLANNSLYESAAQLRQLG